MSDGSLPPSDPSAWVLWAIGIVVTTLAGAIATLWKVGESKNARDIVAAKEQMTEYRMENASIQAELRTEIRVLRDDQKVTEQARLQCEMDRARLDAECKMMTARIDNLEAKNNRDDT
jgi:septal ring factor EnvC (AmiA/AmiB activator)